MVTQSLPAEHPDGAPSPGLASALAYVRAGWSPIPLCWPHDDGRCACPKGHTDVKEIGKAPLLGDDYQLVRVSELHVRSWWERWPAANVGVLLQPSGLFVVDVDGAAGKAEAEQRGLPPGPTSKTGRDGVGFHYFYRAPQGVSGRTTHQGRSKQIDILAAGYVVLPPSKHQTGAAYEWLIPPDAAGLDDAPQWAVDMLTRSKAPTRAPANTEGEPPVRLEGQALERWRGESATLVHGKVDRSDSLFWIGVDLADAGASESTISKALRERDATLGWDKYDDRRDWEKRYGEIAAKAVNRAINRLNPKLARAGSASPDQRPWIPAWIRDLPSIRAVSWDALVAINDPPTRFRQDGLLVRVERTDRDTVVLRELTQDRTRAELADAARYFMPKDPKEDPPEDDAPTLPEDQRKIVLPPTHVVKDLLASKDPPLPPITRIVHVPTFAPNGDLQTTRGYCPASQVYLAPRRGLHLKAVPTQPTPADVAAARSLLVDELLADFPFVEQADRAHAVALFLLTFARDLIEGPTPLHLVEAPEAGTGKGILVEVLLGAPMGQQMGIVAEARDDDEWRKRITAQLREGHPAIILDNISHPLESGILAAALTARIWTDRLLGKSETLNLPVRCVWATTANNPTMSTEIARRCTRIRMDARRDQPWLREPSTFRHPELRRWATAHAADLIWAGLVLVQNWLALGRPKAAGPVLGSFEDWSDVMGGILAEAGIPGFLTNLQEFYRLADTSGAAWRAFVEAWWEKFGPAEVGTADLFPLAQSTEGMDLGKGTDRAQQTRFGIKLKKQRDRVIGSHRVAPAGAAHRLAKWQLIPMDRSGSQEETETGVPGVPRRTFPTPSKNLPARAGNCEEGEKVHPGTPGTPNGADVLEEAPTAAEPLCTTCQTRPLLAWELDTGVCSLCQTRAREAAEQQGRVA